MTASKPAGTTSRLFLPLLVLAATLAGCGDGVDSGAAVTSEPVRDVLANGVERVFYPRLPAPPAAVAGPDLRLGNVEGDGGDVFGDVRGIQVAADGTLFVLDYPTSEIRAFAPDGAYRGALTQKGEGPGELLEANGILMDADGVIWAHDHGQWRYIALDADGNELRRFPIRQLSYGYIHTGAIDRKGGFWKRAIVSDPYDHSAEGLFEGSARWFMARHDPVTDQIDSTYLGRRSGRSFIARFGTSGRMVASVPFDPEHLDAIHADGGFWTVYTDRYRIARLDASGDTVRVIEAETVPVPVSDEQRTRFVEGWAERGPDRRRIAEEILTHAGAVEPVVRQIFMDDEARLWVRRHTSVTAEAGGTTFDVFQDDGTLAGTVRFAEEIPTFFPPTVRDGRLYTRVSDELGVQYVVRIPVPGLEPRPPT